MTSDTAVGSGAFEYTLPAGAIAPSRSPLHFYNGNIAANISGLQKVPGLVDEAGNITKLGPTVNLGVGLGTMGAMWHLDQIAAGASATAEHAGVGGVRSG